ncbi:conserved hypothetical protein [Hyella patelloides LEGE 07179]|uniref:Uncharacterized protein n=1 Tax=Hyella patelloides LEGE 07179 TaxID=945734 RepID=A0A563VLR4_9CYAN|nr:hypothetical protein [Hyella patelloides]VEP12362.1 conserved hypothetical protein [Hyella patelloides LEGE 07179]
MKTNTLHSVTNLVESLVIATVIILVGAIATAQAQNNTPRVANFNSTLNGVFTPTAADRFFKAGREDFSKEIDFLTNSEQYLNGDLLKIDEELMEQMQETQPLHDSVPGDFPISE